ncbi:Chaperone protein HtpG [Rickettsiales bacterium Ac37b]|nr:Chaperone protein HtpG [Rickettsiales bacterium Ac37b]
MSMAPETRKFDAEVGKILHLVIHSLYTNKDIFLRELISNASDACDKLRYLSVTNSALLTGDTELKITISVDEQNRTLTIADNGIGMNKEDLIENLGTIAKSGTQNFINQLTGNDKKDLQLIGQFGVGFYSAFMVAEEVTCITRKAGETQGWMWKSQGEGEFEISSIDGEVSRGTTIHLRLRAGEDEYLDKFRIRHIVGTYSDHISFPVELKEENDQTSVLNKASALWTRPKSEVSEEQYQEFYKHVSHAPDQPWMILHNHNEGTIQYTNLLFVPTNKPFDLFNPERKCRVKLYVKRIFITEDNVNIVPAYLRFLRGVVDSEDLPLNVSRETLQHNNVLEKIRKSIIKRVLNELQKKMDNDRENYLEFWQNFGAVLKEGLCEGIDEYRENILSSCLFKSALTGNLISIDEYINNMKEGQEHIYYYLTGDDNSDNKQSLPQLEGFVKRGIDVLLLSDNVDDFWVNVTYKYKEKEFKSITRADLDLNKIKTDIEEDKSQNNETAINEDEQKHLTTYFKDILGEAIKEAKISQKLVDSPVCLTVSEGSMDIRMEKFLLEQKQLKFASAKILEINPKNPIIVNISHDLNKTHNQGSDMSKELVNLLYDQACIIEGENVKDTAAFCKRLNLLLQKIELV